MNPQLLRLMPLLALLVICAALAAGLFRGHDEKLSESRLVGDQIAAFSIPSLSPDSAHFSPANWQGKVAVLSVFASWCGPCNAEHPLLMKLAQTGIPIYGLAWKDKPEKVAVWLSEHGNPYLQTGIDQRGETTIPLALAGVPETFVIDKTGSIAYHHDAPLTEDIINTTILPLIARLNADATTR